MPSRGASRSSMPAISMMRLDGSKRRSILIQASRRLISGWAGVSRNSRIPGGRGASSGVTFRSIPTVSSPTGHVSISRFWNGRGVTPDPAPVAETIAANTVLVRERIARAARDAQRDPDSVRLVAVSKKFSAAHVRAAVAAGLSDLGENRVQEALAKIAETSDLTVMWHLVGHLQSNKARSAAAAFGWIHSVDSLGLLERIENAAKEAGTRPNVLVQVDSGRRISKTRCGGRRNKTDRPDGSRVGPCHATGSDGTPSVVGESRSRAAFFSTTQGAAGSIGRRGHRLNHVGRTLYGHEPGPRGGHRGRGNVRSIGTALFGPRPPVTQ